VLVVGEAGEALAVVERPFVEASLAAELLEATLAERKWLVDASTGGRDSYRQAQLLYTPPDVAAAIVARIREGADGFCAALGVPAFAPRRVEAQVTVHGDGDFYKPHTDDQGEEAASCASVPASSPRSTTRSSSSRAASSTRCCRSRSTRARSRTRASRSTGGSGAEFLSGPG
jgi:hypothetical protein